LSRNSESFSIKGDAHEQLGNISQAEKCYQKCLKICPNDPLARAALLCLKKPELRQPLIKTGGVSEGNLPQDFMTMLFSLPHHHLAVQQESLVSSSSQTQPLPRKSC